MLHYTFIRYQKNEQCLPFKEQTLLYESFHKFVTGLLPNAIKLSRSRSAKMK